MEELVEAFIKARPAALEHAQKHTVTNRSPSPKRKLYDADFNGQDDEHYRKRTRSSNRISAGSKERTSIIVIDEDGIDEDYQPGEVAPDGTCQIN
jgi:E3 ubiquitin-protein ligase RAD18